MAALTVGNVLDMAKTGELRNIGVKDNDKAILDYINLAMVELYKRFQLKVEEQVINLNNNSTEYELNSDVMAILDAYMEVATTSETNTVRIPVNDENNPYSVNIIAWNKVQVPLSISGDRISLIYSAAPELLVYTGTDIDADSTCRGLAVKIPYPLLEAMLHYVGYRAHGAINADTNTEQNTHYNRFEMSCRRVVELGLITPDSLTSRVTVNSKGFV